MTPGAVTLRADVTPAPDRATFEASGDRVGGFRLLRSGPPGLPIPSSPARGATADPAGEPELVETVEERTDDPWRVILYNDDIHTFEEVIFQLIKATGCTESQAEAYAWQVHTQGKAAVYEGSFEDCFRVQGVLREIQLVTEIEG
jgi:ATP-dependent Clp protease adaptor protein ClpS